jgi:Notch-like protein
MEPDFSSIEIDGRICSNYLDIAKAFITYFSTIAEKISANVQENIFPTSDKVDPLSYLKQVFARPFPCINLTLTSAKEITEIVKSLKSSNSHGYDEIPIKVLKLSFLFISPLIYICNKSLLWGIFPTRLKISQKVPILKKGKKYKMSNYRPISLLISFSKIFEKVIFNRLHNHVHNNNILAPEQYGFRNNLSTESASYNLINNILEALNNKFTVGGDLL